MDKYEFNIKVEQIKKMVARGDYETAMKIADTIDWRRVRNVNILSMAATIYEKNEEYQEAKDILLLAFERAPIGKRLLFKLAELAIKGGSFQEAEDYYREFCDLAPDDPRQYILRYLILGAKGAPVEQLIHTLEQYCNIELDEKWLYELAELYAEADMGDLCIMTCDKIMLMFGLGKYVEKAMELKIQFAPLTTYQMDLVENRDKYEAKLKAVEQEFRMGTRASDLSAVPGSKREMSVPSYKAHREAASAREPEEDDQEEVGQEAGYPEDKYPDGGYSGRRYPEEGYAEEGYAEAEYQGDGYAEAGYQGEGYAEAGYQGDGYAEAGYQGDGYAEAGYQGDGYAEAGYQGEGYAEAGYQGEGYAAQRQPGDEHREDVYTGEDSPEDGYQEVTYPGGRHSVKRYPEEGYPTEYPDNEESDDYDQPRAQVTIEPEEPDETEGQPEEGIQPQWMPDGRAQIMSDETVRARIHEAEVQANLAMEMSRISTGTHRPELVSAQTRVLTDIRDLTKEASAREAHHLMIEAEDSGTGLEQAVEILKKIHKETGARNQAAKITGEKLNSKGLFAIADKLTGKDLIIEQAGTMGEAVLQELNQLMARDETGMNVVLIDRAGNLAHIYNVYPGLAKRFEYVGSSLPGEAAYAAAEGDDRPVRQVQVRPSEEALPRKSQRQPEGALPGMAPRRLEGALPRIVQRQPEETLSKGIDRQPEDVLPKDAQRRPEGMSPKDARRQPEDALPKDARRHLREVPAGKNPKAAVPMPKKDRREEEDPDSNPAQIQSQQAEPEYDDDTELDIDEFAKYACQYAGDIDCSISGKSMLALYERIEIMEEDGIPLNKVNAEDLIEEAADKAENPSFFKRLTGIFSSKYDRDGLLILKEEHFI